MTSRAVRGLIGLVAALLALAGAEPTGPPPPCSHPPRPDALPEARVVRVVDGDTLRARLDDGEERIRLIGLDAPERFPGPRLEHQARQTGVPPQALRRWANAAYSFARRSLAGRAVGVELDVQQRDEFGRLLAYVWTGQVLFNLELVRQGYAWAHPVPPNLRYAERFTACQQDAQATRQGLWGR